MDTKKLKDETLKINRKYHSEHTGRKHMGLASSRRPSQQKTQRDTAVEKRETRVNSQEEAHSLLHSFAPALKNETQSRSRGMRETRCHKKSKS